MNKKVKVLFYNGSLRMGGIERVLTEVLQNINREKMEIDLVIEDETRSLNVFEKDIPKDIKIYYLKPEEIIKKTDFYRQKRKTSIVYKIIYNLMMNYENYVKKKNLKKIVKSNKYNTVIDFDMELSKNIDLIEADKKIAWVHSSIKNWYEKESKIKRLGERLKKYDNIVTICDDMKKSTIKLYPFLGKKIIRIYNPFNFERILFLSNENVSNKLFEEKFIVAVSRLTLHQKDFITLVKGFKKAKELKKFDEKLYVLGDGPDKRKIQDLILKEKMEKEIILLGNIKNPYPWIKNSKMLIHSSKYEGFGLVLVEALILNKIVISSDCPVGPKEILENGEIGHLYEVGNYNKLAELIVENLENPKINTELLNQRIQKYKKENIIKEYEKLILN